MEPISISGLQGVQKKIADAIDDGNGKLEKDEISVFNKVNEILEDSDNTPKTAIEKLKEFLSTSENNVKSCIQDLKGLFIQVFHGSVSENSELEDSDYAEIAEQVSEITETEVTAEELKTLPEEKEETVLTENANPQASVETPAEPSTKTSVEDPKEENSSTITTTSSSPSEVTTTKTTSDTETPTETETTGSECRQHFICRRDIRC